MRRMLWEGKIMGVNSLLVFAASVLVLTLAAAFGGERINMSIVGFEVIYPLLTALAVGEWGKIRADESFDVIAAQSKSLFRWIAARAGTVFLTGSTFAVGGMVIVFFVRKEMPIGEMALLYFAPAFFLSSLSVMSGICFHAEHILVFV